MKLTDRKKQQIILGAVEEFHKNGFSGTSMDAIAQTAEVSKRTVYNHFASKDDLFEGIVQHMFGMVLETSPDAYDAAVDFVEQLKTIARKKIELFVSEEFINLSRVVMPEALHNPEKMQQAMAQMSSIESDMINWFQQAINDKRIKQQNAEEVCSTFMGMVKMDSYWPRLLKGMPVPTPNEIDEMVEKTITMFSCYYFSN